MDHNYYTLRAPLISVASGIFVLRRELAAYFCVTVSVPTAQELANMHPCPLFPSRSMFLMTVWTSLMLFSVYLFLCV